ncbi:MAG: pyruvoyl-dependent arginine decarboxylase [Candidatus Aenigmatarchaeota archaeon]|nr:pyruvoyl-dependent arginine decarboxylase [Candidatus Aenigmarchaeota archaeon]
MNFWMPVAKKFFVTSGRASGETKKGTVQEAFIKAHINQCNLVPVSSVLDPDAVQLSNPPTIPHSAITFCVMAEELGTKGCSIAAGVGWCYMRNKDGMVKKAYVVEDHGHKEERAVKETLMLSLIQMAEAENLMIYNPNNPSELLMNRKEWAEQQAALGKHFDGWKSPEREFLKYLEENASKFFRFEIKGWDKVPEDFGYVVAALVFVFDI